MKPYSAKDWVSNNLELKLKHVHYLYKRKLISAEQYTTMSLALIGFDKIE